MRRSFKQPGKDTAVSINVRRLLIAAAAVVVIVALRVTTFDRAMTARRAAEARLADGVLRITLLGDSVAHGAGDELRRGVAGNLDALLASRHPTAAPVVNLAVNGSRTFDVVAVLRQQATRAVVVRSDVVVLSIGGNDLYGDAIARLRSTLAPAYAMQRTLDAVSSVVAQIHAANPAARIVLLGLYDPYRQAFLDRAVAQWDSGLIARFASEPSVNVVRIADVLSQPDRISSIDHFHPSASGYASIALRIAGAL